MNLLALKQKLEKGKSLGGDVIYIKEDNVLYGLECVYEDQENKSITLLKSNDESIKVNDFLKILDKLCANTEEREVFIGNRNHNRADKKEIKSVEFAQYELLKMLFINVE